MPITVAVAKAILELPFLNTFGLETCTCDFEDDTELPQSSSKVPLNLIISECEAETVHLRRFLTRSSRIEYMKHTFSIRCNDLFDDTLHPQVGNTSVEGHILHNLQRLELHDLDLDECVDVVAWLSGDQFGPHIQPLPLQLTHVFIEYFDGIDKGVFFELVLCLRHAPLRDRKSVV